MTAAEILDMIQKKEQEAETKKIEECGEIVDRYLKKYPEGGPTGLIGDLDEEIAFYRALRFLKRVSKERKKAADTDALIAAIKGREEELDEEIEDSKVM